MQRNKQPHMCVGAAPTGAAPGLCRRANGAPVSRVLACHEPSCACACARKRGGSQRRCCVQPRACGHPRSTASGKLRHWVRGFVACVLTAIPCAAIGKQAPLACHVYAPLRLQFDDLHASGIYSWEMLHDLGQRKVWVRCYPLAAVYVLV
jgi:hypothetical protein